MAWNDWSAFDTVGLIGGALGEKLQPAGKSNDWLASMSFERSWRSRRRS